MTITDSSITTHQPTAPVQDEPARPEIPTQPESKGAGALAGLSLATIVTIATLGHQQLLFALSPDVPEGFEIAGYVMATTLAALIAQYVVIGLAYAKSRFLPTMMFGTVGLGLIAQAACPIDGHVSATAPGFVAQVVSWLAYGMFAIWVLGKNRQAA